MWFRKLGIATIVVVYLVVVAGGVVRSTGAGMGCPDWPKCFGTWVPPTDASQLPPDYQEIFGAKLKGEVVFNAVKTWTEYGNRLVGALAGIFVFATFLASLSYWRKDRPLVWLSLWAFLLMGFQGWLGAKVVATELKPLMVTVHMLVAIVILFILIYAVSRAYSISWEVGQIQRKSYLNRILGLAIGLSVLQVLLGTQLREAIDEVVFRIGYEARDRWIDEVSQSGLAFYIHRSFSLVILGVHLWLLRALFRNTSREGLVNRYTRAMVALVATEVLTGIGMAYFAIPAFLQPVHLTLALILLGVQFVAFLLLNSEQVFGKINRPSGKPAAPFASNV
ncbi:COX15/CtaA family protein [Siphonobacter aquaeclarae]|uniref:Cytochrome c oxidase assembly protein subunit 15 n=1 Tax=Siphonobacter aquaeclarae TaxID=563176 RepID=A0A1G9VJ98_9BACT|nr:COX15/CtaA family protein [Siphonobacter aquaeclarae]MBO9638091.1 COX15/CtaA family protein [Siphonobacter aquaeclarae]SDM72239.1 cytochrome c oxidase assembly protein subunit 15 [Siphonobacter aquaeclarae]